MNASRRAFLDAQIALSAWRATRDAEARLAHLWEVRRFMGTPARLAAARECQRYGGIVLLCLRSGWPRTAFRAAVAPGRLRDAFCSYWHALSS